MSTINEYQDRLRSLIPNAEDELDDTSATRSAVIAAVRTYSRLKPRHLAYDYAGDSATYSFDLPSTFIYDWSIVEGVEYPQGEQTPTYLDTNLFMLYGGTAGNFQLRLLQTPATGYTARMSYTAPHTVDNTTDTVPSADFEAICQLAASMLASELASLYGGTRKSTYEANMVNYRAKSDEWRGISRHFLLNFKMLMGIDAKSSVPAAAVRSTVTRYNAIFRDM